MSMRRVGILLICPGFLPFRFKTFLYCFYSDRHENQRDEQLRRRLTEPDSAQAAQLAEYPGQRNDEYQLAQ